MLATNATASGKLTVNGGEVDAGEFVRGASDGAAATAIVNNGILRVTNATAIASMVLARGALTVNGGSIEVDSLVATNSSGTLRFNGGTIESRDTHIANGAAFVVGDGTHAATFRLNGGTHVFQNGVVISANASVVGCGTIVGTIQNNGTLSTNCGAATAPAISGGQFSFQIQTEAGATYTVEYKENLSDPAWTKLNTYNGTGGAVTVTDTLAAATRFYRAVIY